MAFIYLGLTPSPAGGAIIVTLRCSILSVTEQIKLSAGTVPPCWCPGRLCWALEKTHSFSQQTPGDWQKYMLFYMCPAHWWFPPTPVTHGCHIRMKIVPDTGWKWRTFDENLHHSLFAFLAWGIHINLHCLQKTAKLLHTHNYGHKTAGMSCYLTSDATNTKCTAVRTFWWYCFPKNVSTLKLTGLILSHPYPTYLRHFEHQKQSKLGPG